MNKVNVVILFAALLVIGACAEPRKLLTSTGQVELVAAEEHQRILAELEEVSALRERMLQEGKLAISIPFNASQRREALLPLQQLICAQPACSFNILSRSCCASPDVSLR